MLRAALKNKAPPTHTLVDNHVIDELIAFDHGYDEDGEGSNSEDEDHEIRSDDSDDSVNSGDSDDGDSGDSDDGEQDNDDGDDGFNSYLSELRRPRRVASFASQSARFRGPFKIPSTDDSENDVERSSKKTAQKAPVIESSQSEHSQ